MEKTITRSFCFDGDICDVLFRYDEASGKYFGDYPDFEEQPRYTGTGKMWVTAMQTSCAYAKNKYTEEGPCDDCGSCIYLHREQQGDLIGICMHALNDKPAKKK